MARALIAARISQAKGDEASRIERDDEQARQWAEREGHTVVGIAADRGVSGGTHPLKRKQLAPWLTDPANLAQYDILVASTVDRLGRSMIALPWLRQWADENGKVVVILSPAIRLPGDPSAALMFNQLGSAAEFELAIIRQRIANARTTIKKNHGLLGKLVWGFESTGDKYAKGIRPVPTLVPVLQGMVDRALHGDTLRSIATWLDAEGVATRQDNGRGWSVTSVRQILKSEALKGTYRNGTEVVRFASILTAGDWNTLQTAIDRGHHGPPNADDVMIPPETIRCGHCSGAMYRIRSTTTRKDGSKQIQHYYRCKGTEQKPSTCRNTIRQDTIEAWVSEWFTGTGPFAHHEVVEVVMTAGVDHTAEADDVAAEIRDLDVAAPDFIDRVTTLKTEHARLLALPTEPSTRTERPTGETVSTMWAGLDAAGRRGYLKAAGMRVVVRVMDLNHEAGGIDGRHTVTPYGDPHQVISALRAA